MLYSAARASGFVVAVEKKSDRTPARHRRYRHRARTGNTAIVVHDRAIGPIAKQRTARRGNASPRDAWLLDARAVQRSRASTMTRSGARARRATSNAMRAVSCYTVGCAAMDGASTMAIAMRMFVGACVCGLLAGQAAATEGKAALGQALEEHQKTSGPVLRGETLRRCKQLDEELFLIDRRLVDLGLAIDDRERRKDSLGWDLDRALEKLDRTDQAAIDRYNRDIERHEQLVAQYNRLLPEFNELVRRQVPRVDEFNAKCAEIKYYKKEWNGTKVVLDPDLLPPETPL
jgi:hypothetical protein